MGPKQWGPLSCHPEATGCAENIKRQLGGNTLGGGGATPRAHCVSSKSFAQCCVTNRGNPWVCPLRGMSPLTRAQALHGGLCSQRTQLWQQTKQEPQGLQASWAPRASCVQGPALKERHHQG